MRDVLSNGNTKTYACMCVFFVFYMFVSRLLSFSLHSPSHRMILFVLQVMMKSQRFLLFSSPPPLFPYHRQIPISEYYSLENLLLVEKFL